MTNELLKLIEDQSPGSTPLYIVIRGSHAYGTNVPTSDTDYAGVFIQPLDDILGFNYKEQINDNKNDIVFYEVKRFLQLLQTNNPNILELLNTPEDCVIYKHPIFDLILEHKEKFVTKLCANSFVGYAYEQISKAKGMNKKQNWEEDKITRKDVLDFCYVIENEKTINWKTWNKKYDEKFCGVVNIPNAHDVYAVFYDIEAANCFSDTIPQEQRENAIQARKKANLSMGFGYKGIVKSDIGKSVSESNQLRLSSIPMGEKPICTIFYNKDAYTQHCKDYKSYEEWLEKRNIDRWVDVKTHGQRIDGKNMLHCTRLIQMAHEMAEGKGIIVRRPNASELIKIRKGEVDLQSILDNVENEIHVIKQLFENSNLPEKVDPELLNKLLIKIRKEIYKC